jgi:predicted RNA methylase
VRVLDCAAGTGLLAVGLAQRGFLGVDGAVETAAERLKVWPFTAETLEDDLRAAGLAPDQSTYAPDVERYLVTAIKL